MAYFFKDYEFAARYPFSSISKEIMRGRNVDAGDRMAELGYDRLASALGGGIRRRTLLHEDDALEEIISYASARMILSCMRNRFLTNRYAVAEAKKTFSYLGTETEENVLSIAKDLGILSFSRENGSLTVGVADFLMYAPRDSHYKLITRSISAGRVRITSHERIRLIEEAVKKYSERIPEPQGVPPQIRKAADRLHSLLPRIEPQKVSFREGENPPCMEALLDMVRKHENVGHTGRWLLAVYLINNGMSTQDIAGIFSNAPDFSERTTIYQVEHARKRGYKMPTCQSVLGYGYCTAKCGIPNPMRWRPAMRKPEEKVGKDG